jgi:YVTN family beta-propeller protein
LRIASAAAVALTAIAGCRHAGTLQRSEPPLGDRSAAYVYLDPLPAEARRLGLSIASVALVRSDGAEEPLELLARELSGGEPQRQRLLASGRIPPGTYPTLLVTLARATLRGSGGAADLVVPKDPVPVPIPLDVRPGQASVVEVSLQLPGGVEPETELAPRFGAVIPERAMTQLAGYVTDASGAAVTVFDTRTRRVLGVLAVGRDPRGVALDAEGRRAHVALAGEDQVQVVDTETGTELARVMLRAGDRPREVALTPDGRVLLVLAEGANAVSFVDPGSATEQDRTIVGEEPWAVVLDRAGRRAYVLDRRSGDVAVIATATRTLVARVPVDPEPVQAALNRAGTSLYLVHAGSAYLSILSTETLAVVDRIFVGLGAVAVAVDTRTDLIYVARRDDRAVQVLDPASRMPIGSVELPGNASRLLVDDIENALVAVIPDRRQVVYVDLAGRRIVGVLDVGANPHGFALVHERR